MKQGFRKGFLATFITIGSLAATAQSNSLGINGGFGHAWFSNNTGSRFKPAANIGLSFIHSTKSSFGFGAELKYSVEGGKSVVNNVTRTTSLDYIRVPLKAMYFFGTPGKRIRPKISIGPSLGFLIGGEEEVESVSGTVTQTSVARSRDLYKHFDIGLNATAGLNYRLVKNTWFMADINYYKGFLNIREPLVGSTAPKRFNNNIGVNVGINWGIGSSK